MSNFRMGRDYQNVYITEKDVRGAPLTQGPRSPPYEITIGTRQQQAAETFRKNGLPTYKPIVYRHPDEVDDNSLPRGGHNIIRPVDPAYVGAGNRKVTYRTSETYSVGSPAPPSSPPPPPYSPPRPRPTNPVAERTETTWRQDSSPHTPTGDQPYGGYDNEGFRKSGSPVRSLQGQIRPGGHVVDGSGAGYSSPPTPSSMQQRSPSPFQERKDVITLVPTYTAAYAADRADAKYPEGAPSKIVYSTHMPPQGQGQVSSKPMTGGGGIPDPPPPPNTDAQSTQRYQRQSYEESPPSSPMAKTYNGSQPAYKPLSKGDQSPRPYQLKPTMDKLDGAVSNSSAVGRGLVSGTQQANHAGSNRSPEYRKEDEVDALTNLLIQNMQVSGDPDFFGPCAHCGYNVQGQYNACAALGQAYHIRCFRCVRCGMCARCGRSIMGENTGCTALDQLFHIECFTCDSCDACLRGQPFFTMEGKPYCECCYMNTLEKCSVCSKPITDRIIRATGKPYHPCCFVCVVCGKSLDGVPFTVDATNQIHCIEDFHKKFAPRCCVCGHPIMPEAENNEETVRIVAMDRSFHVKCYTCEDCGQQLSSEADGRGCYPLDENILCKGCNAARIQALTTRMTTEL